MLRFLILLATLQAISADKPAWSDTKAACQAFLSVNGITLSDLTQATYNTNYEALVELNKTVTYELGVTCFTLLTLEQRKRFELKGMEPPADAVMSEGAVEGGNSVEDAGHPMPGDAIMPDEYSHADMMMMTDARNQGGCGSCWAFSALSQLENTYIKYTGDWYEGVDFSEQQLVDCSYADTVDSCEGGWMSVAWQTIFDYDNNKVCSEEQYPYVSSDGNCTADATGKDNAFAKMQLRTNGGSNVYRWYSDDISTTKTHKNGTSYIVMAESTAQFVWQNYSVSVALQAETAFFNYRSGIFNTQSEGTSINHAVTIFGYTQEYFNIQNSWGLTTWGENGCGKVSRRDGNIIQMFDYMMYPYVECAFGVNQAGYCKTSATDDGCMCYNGGLCKSEEGAVYCQCQSGWVGDDCSEKGDCDCRNGGTCVESEVSACADDPIYTSSCPTWVSYGYCDPDGTTGYYSFMKSSCAKSCEFCSVAECYTQGYADLYDGEESVTSSGKTCQNWAEQSPQTHSYTPIANFTSQGLGDHNYCRSIDHDAPWCYTTDSSVRWEECDVPLCAGSCDCTEGWTGEHCQAREKCYDCVNGICEANVGECQCNEGWEGDNCDREEGDGTCGCKNGGQCNKYGGCDCLDGFSGNRCEEVDCKDGDCANGGTCKNDGTCDCQDGFTGDKCETVGCDCLNGGLCNTDGTCNCPDGFSGDKCETKDFECKEGDCENGGFCNSDDACECQDDFSGDKCEEDNRVCDKKCKKGKVCYWKTDDKMKCKCPDGSYGKGCVENADCTMLEGKVCAKKMKKDMVGFVEKCKKPWGVKKCPHSCGFCQD